MVVVMEEHATEAQIQSVVAQLTDMGFDVHRSTGATRTVIGAVGGGTGDPLLIGVQEPRGPKITEPHKLASRSFKRENTIITIDDGASAEMK
jgi:3-deoxy-7-phosphoheptulonate synthase